MEKIVIETVMFEDGGIHSSSNENPKINTLLDAGWIIKEMTQYPNGTQSVTKGVTFIFHLKKVE